MNISINTQKASVTLIGSMLGFIVAKKYCPTESYPFILIGGFIGTCIGEELIKEEQKEIISL